MAQHVRESRPVYVQFMTMIAPMSVIVMREEEDLKVA